MSNPEKAPILTSASFASKPPAYNNAYLPASTPGVTPVWKDQPPAYNQPYVEGPAVTAPPPGFEIQNKLDPLALQKFSSLSHYSMRQANLLAETVCGCCANSYVITDRERVVPVIGREQDRVEAPIFLAEEESSLCCRCCCPQQHPVLVRLYHAAAPVAGKTVCGCCYTGHIYSRDTLNPSTVLTLERDACCAKWVGCLVCGDKCQSEAFVHAGDVEPGTKPGSFAYSNPDAIGRSKVPLDHCWHPTLEVFEKTSKGEQIAATLVGPTCFGGCMDLCFPTKFELTSQTGGDIGAITKLPPESFCELCCQAAGDVDNYNIDFRDPALSPIQKANHLATAIHVDYWFFQHDVRPVERYGDGQSGVIVITCCLVYVKGCLCPVQVCIPYGKK